MSKLKWINLGLRVTMELGIVLAFGYVGYYIGRNTIQKILLCIFIPAIGFGFWGLVNFHQFGKYAETLRLGQELLVSGLAAFALYLTGMHRCGLALGILSIIYHALVYLNSERLLKH